ncbi:MAG: hypothetical protein Q7T00_01520 [Rugosibacter sp.]|nr:hypothetical protein [Rugosibacter sp.]
MLAPDVSGDVMDCLRDFTDKEISRFVRSYMARTDLKETDDPIDDWIRFIFMAHGLPGANQQIPSFERKSDSNGRRMDFIPAAVAFLFAVNPSLSPALWNQLFMAVLRERYGGTTVRLKKRPAESKRLDAKRMTAAQLMDKHGIGRSRAYQLLNEVRKKK